MRIDILTLFPEMFKGIINTSMLRIARDKGLLEICTHNIRDYSASKHKNTDDYPFGGGAGMVMMVQPIVDCLRSISGYENARRICMSPRGRVFTQKAAIELSEENHIIILCGHYEGIDERALEFFPEEISIGDYILTGGEIPAMTVVDCVSRLIDGVLGSGLSIEDESFSAGLLEYPQYTRPAEFEGMNVPDVLLNGNHAKIKEWRRRRSIKKTFESRPELLEKTELDRKEKAYLDELISAAENGENGRNSE